MDPRGKGVFLTGGAQGLGRGIVEELLSLGAKVRKLNLETLLIKNSASIHPTHRMTSQFF